MRITVPKTITNDDILSVSVALDDYTAWVDDWTYSLGDQVKEGVIAYESLANNNEENQPSLTTGGVSPKWAIIGNINAYAMFDEYVNTSTMDNDDISVVIQKEAISRLHFFGLQGAELSVSVKDGDSNEIYAETFDLFAGQGLYVDWWEYFYSADLVPSSTISVDLEFTTQADDEIDVVIAGEGDQMRACGMLLCGSPITLGTTQWNASLQGLSYSKKDTNEYGNTYLKQGANSKLVKATAHIKSAREAGYVEQYLASVDATAVVWDFSENNENYGFMTVYGFWSEWVINPKSYNETYIAIEINGMI